MSALRETILRQFVGLHLDRIPDESTILNFRQLQENTNSAEGWLEHHETDHDVCSIKPMDGSKSVFDRRRGAPVTRKTRLKGADR